jgi:hypothetical protein
MEAITTATINTKTATTTMARVATMIRTTTVAIKAKEAVRALRKIPRLSATLP